MQKHHRLVRVGTRLLSAINSTTDVEKESALHFHTRQFQKHFTYLLGSCFSKYNNFYPCQFYGPAIKSLITDHFVLLPLLSAATQNYQFSQFST